MKLAHQIDYDPLKALAVAILYRAVRDWKRHHQFKADLEIFFRSGWFGLFCETVQLDPDVVREKLGVHRIGKE